MPFTQKMDGMKNHYFISYTECSCSNISYSKKSGHIGYSMRLAVILTPKMGFFLIRRGGTREKLGSSMELRIPLLKDNLYDGFA
jgi:hypothetical protein